MSLQNCNIQTWAQFNPVESDVTEPGIDFHEVFVSSVSSPFAIRDMPKNTLEIDGDNSIMCDNATLLALCALERSGKYMYKSISSFSLDSLINSWIATYVVVGSNYTEEIAPEADTPKYEIREPTNEEMLFYKEISHKKNKFRLRAVLDRTKQIKKLRKLKRACRKGEREFVKDQLIHLKMSPINVPNIVIRERLENFWEKTGSKRLTNEEILSDKNAIDFLANWMIKQKK